MSSFAINRRRWRKKRRPWMAGKPRRNGTAAFKEHLKCGMHSRENSKPNRIDQCIYVPAEANGKVLAASKETAEGEREGAGGRQGDSRGEREGDGGQQGDSRASQGRCWWRSRKGASSPVSPDLLGFAWIYPDFPSAPMRDHHPSAQTPAPFLCSLRSFAAIPSSIPSGRISLEQPRSRQ